MQCAIYILNFGQMKNEIYKGTNGVRSPTEGICQMKNDFGQMAKHIWQMKLEARPSGFPYTPTCKKRHLFGQVCHVAQEE